MASTYMIRKRQRELAAMKTPESERRIRLQVEAGKRAEADFNYWFPFVTPQNAAEAIEYQQRRISYWKQQYGV